MANFTLRQLKYFDALARHGHFGRAADACAISQPALSVQIKELEQSLGTLLFDRSAKKVQLTAFGETFAPRAREILRAADELDDLSRTMQDRLAGRLRLGVIPTVAPYLLPRVITRITAQYPAVALQVRETQTSGLIEELSQGGLDAAIVALPVSEPTLTEVPLFSESFVLVRPAADADKPVPGRERLREMRLLLLEEGHCFRDQALSFCNMSPALPREWLDGSTLSTLVQMVGVGFGVTLIPEMAVEIETRSADVAVSRLAAPEPQRTIGMVWRRSNPLHPRLAELAQVVRAATQSRAARPAP